MHKILFGQKNNRARFPGHRVNSYCRRKSSVNKLDNLNSSRGMGGSLGPAIAPEKKPEVFSGVLLE